jgi:dCMP deaminase
MRISRAELNISIAQLIAKRSICARQGVGAVAIRDGRIIATGYNGPTLIRGLEKCNCDVSKACTESIHAEANLVAFSARHGVPLEGSTIFITLSPCMKCAELMLQAGIAGIIYLEEYRDKTAVEYLTFHGVSCDKYEDLQPTL